MDSSGLEQGFNPNRFVLSITCFYYFIHIYTSPTLCWLTFFLSFTLRPPLEDILRRKKKIARTYVQASLVVVIVASSSSWLMMMWEIYGNASANGMVMKRLVERHSYVHTHTHTTHKSGCEVFSKGNIVYGRYIADMANFLRFFYEIWYSHSEIGSHSAMLCGRILHYSFSFFGYKILDKIVYL